MKLYNFAVDISVWIIIDPATGAIGANSTDINISGFQGMYTNLEGFELGGNPVDWTTEEAQTSFMEIISSKVGDALPGIEALVDGLLNNALKVKCTVY